jgi:hypothetical protein
MCALVIGGVGCRTYPMSPSSVGVIVRGPSACALRTPRSFLPRSSATITTMCGFEAAAAAARPAKMRKARPIVLGVWSGQWSPTGTGTAGAGAARRVFSRFPTCGAPIRTCSSSRRRWHPHLLVCAIYSQAAAPHALPRTLWCGPCFRCTACVSGRASAPQSASARERAALRRARLLPISALAPITRSPVSGYEDL